MTDELDLLVAELPPRPARGRATIVVVSLWLAIVALGLGMLWRYKSTPGQGAHAPERLPADVTLPHHDGRALVVVLAHPFCPCTRATISELSDIAPRLAEHADIVVVLTLDDDQVDDWKKSDLYASATRVFGAQTVLDPGGVLAARFGAATSGQTLVYDASGRLAYAGGLTGSRGHVGPNAAEDAMLAAVLGPATTTQTAPVFGCSLTEPEKEAPR